MNKFIFASALAFLSTQSTWADMHHVKLLGSYTPDLSSIETFGHDIGDRWQKNNDKAIIMSYWTDQLTTYAEPLYYSRQWDDPIAFLNNNPYGMCSDLTLMFDAIGEGAFGFTGRHYELPTVQHTIPQINYDGTLHFFDPSFGMAYGLHDDGIVAPLSDFYDASSLAKLNIPTALTRDPDGEGPIKAPLSVDKYDWTTDDFLREENDPKKKWVEKRTEGYFGVHRFDLDIPAYAYYTRYWSPLTNLPGFTAHDFYWPHYNYSQTSDMTWHDNNIKEGEHRTNGLWVYEPDLSDESAYESEKNILQSNGTLNPIVVNKEAEIVFKLDTANFITGVLLEADVTRMTKDDHIMIEASSSGGALWFPVWDDAALGNIHIKENISDMVRGTLKSQDLRHVTDLLVRVKLKSNASVMDTALKHIKISTITMLNKYALPKLRLGKNEIILDKAVSDNAYETKTLNPVLTKLENGDNGNIHWRNEEAWKQYTVDNQNITSGSNFGNLYTRMAKTTWKKGWMTYELDAPRPIRRARLGGSFILRQGSHDATDIKYRVFDGAWSEWREVAHYDDTTGNVTDKRDNQSHLEEWNILEDGVSKVQFRVEQLSYAQLEALHMAIDYEAKETLDRPLYVTYSWKEFHEDKNGNLDRNGLLRTYKEKITSLPHKFIISTSGDIQPEMNWVSMNLEGYEDPKNHATLGYHDGIDSGDKDYIPYVKYEIGKLISLHKPITLSKTPANGDKSLLVDGEVLAASDAHDLKADKSHILTFQKGIGSLEAVIDLGAIETVGGARIDAYKDSPDTSFPARIDVEVSTDGVNYKHVANDPYKSAKYAYNLWPITWSLPAHTATKSAESFPNYGLVSNYIFVPFSSAQQARYVKIKIKEQNNNNQPKGFALAEIHLYDKLIAHTWGPKLNHVDQNLHPNQVQTISANKNDSDNQDSKTIALEAESGMLKSLMIAENDPLASHGQYITNRYGHGIATYTLDIQVEGEYIIWANYIAPSSREDSYYISIDGKEDIWDMSDTCSWKWGKIKGRSKGGTRTFHLTKGSHTLTIRAREPHAAIDKIIVTSDAHIQPKNEAKSIALPIEAESGELTSSMIKKSDSSASGESFITNNYGHGVATYRFNIDTEGDFLLWAREIAPNGHADSFYISVDDKEDVWDMPNTASWIWSKVHGRSEDGTRIFHLSKGAHVLKVRAREPHAAIDKIIITNDAHWDCK